MGKHKNITAKEREKLSSLPTDGVAVISTGPVTSASKLKEKKENKIESESKIENENLI